MATPPDAGVTEPPIRSRVVARLAAPMTQGDVFGRGPLAELRRLDPNGALAEPALHRLLARHVTDEMMRGIGLARWALVIHCAALAAPDGLSMPGRAEEPADAGERPAYWAKRSRQAQERFGRMLYEADCNERRFINLLDASVDELQTSLPRAVRILLAKGKRLHILAVADLVASAAGRGEDDRSDAVRHTIARGYYRAEAKSDNEQNQSPGDAA